MRLVNCCTIIKLHSSQSIVSMHNVRWYLQGMYGAITSQGPLPQGRLRAKVVAADSIRSSDTQKEVVVYKIRAADANSEWTVSRRYSNFELLHRQLRDVSLLFLADTKHNTDSKSKFCQHAAKTCRALYCAIVQ